MQLRSKLADGGDSIFSIIARLSNKHNAINLGQGYPNFDCSDDLKELVHKYLHDNKNQYAPMPGVLKLREAISKKAQSLYDINLSPASNICITAGATQAIFTAITAFVNKGDEVITIEPAYDSYRPSIEIQGAINIAYSLTGPEFQIDWEEFEDLVSDRTSMIIINSPHNPTGRVLKPEDLLQLEKILDGKNIILLSDEVYEHIIFDGREHESILKYPKLFNQSIATFSFGKTFHNTGWKLGYSIAPEWILTEFKKIHQWNVFCVNSFLQYALADYLENENTYLELSSFYQEKRNLLTHALADSKLKALPSQGTYFQLYDYSAISESSDIEFTEWLIKEHGVASIPLSPFYSKDLNQKYIRLCFAKTDNILLKAAEKLSKI